MTKIKTMVIPLESRDGKIAESFARAKYYVVKPIGGKLAKVISNPYTFSRNNTSAKVLNLLMKYNVEVVYARNIGDRMKRLLEKNGIKIFLTKREWL